ncbi:hypothetical protein [Haloferula sargassicola]|uniref:Uncharacterized protein n=1 Tax=Haloferula sargassicola TaxID=490096 RepID=A0ABP9UTH5_9BACT
MKRDKVFAIFGGMTMLLLIGVLIWMIFVPLDSDLAVADRIVAILPMIMLLPMIILGAIATNKTGCEQRGFRTILWVICSVLLLADGVLDSERKVRRGKLEWVCEGVIVNRYLSDNHQYPTLMVSGAIDANLEGVDVAFYEAAKVGDKVVKKPWHEHALLNGRMLRILSR